MRAFLVHLVAGTALAAVPSHAQNAGWDGTWVGKWGNIVPSRIVISGGKVVDYRYRGKPQPTGKTKISRHALRFGTDLYSIVMDRTGRSTAKASYWTRGRVRGIGVFTRR
jgi:hypothetical protein